MPDAALTLPFAGLFAKTAEAGPSPAMAKRFIVFYFPDGVPASAGHLGAMATQNKAAGDKFIVLCCSEISDGNTHSHDDMPFILAGGASAGLRTGRLFDTAGRRHSDLLGTIAHAMGDRSITTYGQGGQGLLAGLLA